MDAITYSTARARLADTMNRQFHAQISNVSIREHSNLYGDALRLMRCDDLKGFDIGTWFGVLAPAATPRDIVVRLNAEMVKVIQSPDFKKRMQDIGAEPIGNTPAQMAEQIASDTTRFAKLVADHKITTD